jgi:hypothetical protein
MMLAKRLLSRRRWKPFFWFDADDPSTIAQSSGVTQWADKSGNGLLATPPLAAKPTYTSSGIGGRGSIVFPATSAPLLVPAFAAPTGADGLLVAMVIQKTGEPSNYSNPLTYGAVNAQWSFVLPKSGVGTSNGASKCIWRNRSVDLSQVTSANNFGVNTPHVVVATLKDSDGMALYFEGDLEGTRAPATHVLGNAAALTIGSSPDSSYSSNRFQGVFGEILAVYGDTSASAVSDIRNYLIDKWL